MREFASMNTPSPKRIFLIVQDEDGVGEMGKEDGSGRRRKGRRKKSDRSLKGYIKANLYT